MLPAPPRYMDLRMLVRQVCGKMKRGEVVEYSEAKGREERGGVRRKSRRRRLGRRGDLRGRFHRLCRLFRRVRCCRLLRREGMC